jgi:diguanylate cyclase (GGDEF)-like protein/PAS domain S-box-containing protein
MLLSDLVTYQNDQLSLDATLNDAVEQMECEDESYVVLMDRSIVMGILTLKNIMELYAQGIKKEGKAIDFAGYPVLSIHNNRPIDMAVEIMIDHEIRHIVLIDENDQYVGTLTEDNILHYCEKNPQAINESIPYRCLRNRSLHKEYPASTEELRLEAKLRDAKATYNLLGIAFCEIVDLGESQIIKWLNAEAMLTFQVKIDDPVSQMVGVENWDRLMEAFRVHRGVEHEQIEVNGRIYELTLMEAEVNNQSVMKLFLNDVSDLIRLSEELALSLNHTIELEKEKSKLYLEVASVMFLVLDPEGNIVLLNPKGCEILGVTKEEAIGKNWFDTFVVKEQISRSKELFSAMVEGKQEIIEYYENKLHTKYGEERIIAWHNALLRDSSGAISGTFSSGDDITKIQESEKEIQRMAHYDALTNLPNRLLLSARLEHSIARAEREKTKLVVLYVDIDNFKDINESYGYSIGDFIIKHVSSKMEALIRHEDTISRIGGDEFIILLEEIQDVSECKRTLKQIIHLFNEAIATPEGDLKLSVSIGISLYPDDGESGETLLKNADIALRRAKEEVKSSYCFFTQEMSVRLLERVLMERELRRAVEDKEFIVYYQPQVDLLSGAVIGAEALVRWQHPSLGIVRPDVFIPLAESNHLIIPIGEEVLAKSCKAVKKWKEEGLFEGRISVNVSGKQFERPDVVSELYKIITDSGLDAQFVELEITESVLMSNPKVLGEKLIALKGLGIEIAIDDFGTGYSSLSYLKAFPIDKLKIDQSFVRGLPENDQDSAIVKAIIAMAEALGFTTIAEGIEEPKQAKFLQEHGCMQGQGYVYARPLDEKAFEAFLIREGHRNTSR